MWSARQKTWVVEGVGIGGLREADDVLDMGNSGTSTRLLAGLFAPYPHLSVFTGDASLRKRPMKRVITPLEQMGVRFTTNAAQTLPMAMQGSSSLLPITYTLPVASAQVKSAIMLAAMNIAGKTTVIEPVATRDHTERMFQAVGIPVSVEKKADGTHITVTGQPKLTYQDREMHVPGDPSSAAFLTVAALITEGSDITLRHICLNDTRIGVYHSLREMGADITFENPREVQGEPVADLRVRHSRLKGITVPRERAPSMIDEYPVLAMAAACAEGKTSLLGLEELRVKESDRFAAIVEGLRACGVSVDVNGDDMVVHGSASIAGGATIATRLDHRIAMSFLVLGLRAEKAITVDDIGAINTSFPSFIRLMREAGADIHVASHLHMPLPLRRKSDARFVVAIDGPAASGKGTLARRLADHFNVPHLDTGSLYRAVALRLLAHQGDPNVEADAVEAATSITLHDLSNPRLRDEQVGNIASIVSAMPKVRQALLEFQRDFAAEDGGAILDGRDIGTVVSPDALVKIFITASIEARAERRHKELQNQGIEVVYESVLRDLMARDKRDSERQAAPLVPAPDAILIDSTGMSVEEVFGTVVLTIQREIEAAAAKKAVG
jgi:3-phosphoshikimate 1-carboxyvinyltransferase